MRAAARLSILIFAVGACALACRSSQSGGALAGGALASGTLVAATSDGRVAAAPTGPVVILRAGGRALPFRVELATSEPQRERGLMYRNHLDPDAGMLFVFEREAPLTFWMKNTLIPLDMIFISGKRRIVGVVENAVPETETPRRVEGLSRYVLEIAGGMSRKLGISAESEVEFQGLPRDVLAN
jgi:uncharacterized protein